MFDRSKLWTTTGDLYALAGAVIALALAIGNSNTSHHYEFTPAAAYGAIAVRGDTLTRKIVLCAIEPDIKAAAERGRGDLHLETCF